MRLVVLPSDDDGAAHYRLKFPARKLALQYGWDIVEPPHVRAGVAGTKRSLLLYGVYDIVGRRDLGAGRVELRHRIRQPLDDWLLDEPFDVLLMPPRPDEPFWPEVFGRLRSQGKRVLLDSDDAWWGLPSWNPGSRRPPKHLAAVKAQLRAADGLSVSTPALADLYRPYQPDVRVIRNRLDWGMWADTVPVYERPTRRLRVGWMGDSKYRTGDLRVLRGFIGPWLKRNPDVEFVAAGDPRAHDLCGVPVAQRVSVAETHFRNFDLADITATFDIGLVPLDLSTPSARRLNECKSHLKGLEYNACGIPFIASPSESYRWFVDNGGVGQLAASPAEWRKWMDYYLAEDFRLGFLARRSAERWSVQSGVSEWEDWLGADSDPHPHPARTLTAA